MQVICEFLEHATSQAAGASSTPIIDPLLTIGAVRVLGRFLADAPDAHEEAVRKLLPRLLALQTPGEGPLSSSGVCFLLPALLSWTSSSSPSHRQWVDVLLDARTGCLQVLTAFAREAAATATGLASMAGAAQFPSSSSSSGGCTSDAECLLLELQSVESRLGTACLVLHQLLSSLPAARAWQQGITGSSRAAEQQRAQDAYMQPFAVLLRQLGSWAALRIKQHQQRQQQGGVIAVEGPPAVRAAAAFVSSLEAVQVELPVLLPAAALAGQLLVQLAGRAAGAGPSMGTCNEDAAAQLQCWGCEAGWSYNLLEAWQEEVAQQAAPHVRHRKLDWEALLGQLRDAWLGADLATVWDACLTSAAELLVERLCDSMGHGLLDAAWVREAVQAAAADQDRQSAAARALVENSMALQLLVKACSDIP